MSELHGHSILIVVNGEVSPFINELQGQIERSGGETLVAGDHPDAITDTLATFDFTAAVVSAEGQAVVAELSVPMVIYYEGDKPEQIIQRLQRVLS